jgi:hypothetical protein
MATLPGARAGVTREAGVTADGARRGAACQKTPGRDPAAGRASWGVAGGAAWGAEGQLGVAGGAACRRRGLVGVAGGGAELGAEALELG